MQCKQSDTLEHPAEAMKLVRLNYGALSHLAVEFLKCRNAILHRFELVNSCYDRIPWCIVALLEGELDPQARPRVVKKAAYIIQTFDANRSTTRYGPVDTP